MNNKLIFPLPSLVKSAANYWYEMPGYTENSPFLTFAVPGYLYLYEGQKLRIAFGESLLMQSKRLNMVGLVCMDILVYTP